MCKLRYSDPDICSNNGLCKYSFYLIIEKVNATVILGILDFFVTKSFKIVRIIVHPKLVGLLFSNNYRLCRHDRCMCRVGWEGLDCNTKSKCKNDCNNKGACFKVFDTYLIQGIMFVSKRIY
jgi:hypothetical protein